MENNKRKKAVIDLTVSAMLLAAGLLLPFLTGQIKQIGSMLLPMHIPVLLCGLICGWQYGLGVGSIMPLLRFFIFGKPNLYPTAVAMAFELAAYGGISGLLYGRSEWKCIVSLYRSIIAAMIGGRAVWGVAMMILLGVQGSFFTFEAFAAGAFLNAIPGIILQLVFIPALMLALDKTGLVRFTRKQVRNTEDV